MTAEVFQRHFSGSKAYFPTDKIKYDKVFQKITKQALIKLQVKYLL